MPFTYSAEAYPLYIRATGMSLATATTWFFNAIISLTWPSIAAAWTAPGGFAWYGAWNLAGFVCVLLLLPETKEKTLEELDAVFDVPLSRIVRHGLAELAYFWRRYVLRRRRAVAPVPPTSADILRYAGRPQPQKERGGDPPDRV